MVRPIQGCKKIKSKSKQLSRYQKATVVRVRDIWMAMAMQQPDAERVIVL